MAQRAMPFFGEPAVAAEAAFEQQAFFEYHLYTLQRRSTLADRQVKQIELLSAEAVAVTKEYYLGPGIAGTLMDHYWDRAVPGLGEKVHPEVKVVFENTEANGLGIPLPAGLVRLNKRDPKDEAVEFIGEDRIRHTPRNEKLTLTVGEAFDVVAERKQVAFELNEGRRRLREEWEIEIRNRKENEAVTVRVVERLFRGINWEIEQHSHPFQRLEARTVEFPVEVKADETVKLTYTVRYTW